MKKITQLLFILSLSNLYGQDLRSDSNYIGPKNGSLVIVGGALKSDSILLAFIKLAGATIQGSFLIRGDTKNNQTLMGDHQEGFGFLKNVAIDQHVLVRNRQFDMFEILQVHPKLLGIGIDENTAIVVQGNQFKVIGESYVLMYDGSFWSREGNLLKNGPNKTAPFYLLKAGDRYDL